MNKSCYISVLFLSEHTLIILHNKFKVTSRELQENVLTMLTWDVCCSVNHI